MKYGVMKCGVMKCGVMKYDFMKYGVMKYYVMKYDLMKYDGFGMFGLICLSTGFGRLSLVRHVGEGLEGWI